MYGVIDRSFSCPIRLYQQGCGRTVLVTFLNHLKLTPEQQSELVELLGEKYRTLGANGIDLILDRIKNIMTVCCNSEKDAFDFHTFYRHAYYLDSVKKLCIDVVCHEMKDDVKSIILFGGWARGDYIVDSNLDVAVLTGCNRGEAEKYADTFVAITSESCILWNVRFVLIPYDEFQEKKSWYPYFKYIDTEGEVIFG